ncbi:hypothetical protein PAECIP111893_04821 [Paenibacillus plantiphilus]|uniref:Histidine kinase n=1 Tax=Paenibacillus plantiphilus TaxID=2905650 RepID=A0ABN8GYF3_9BACL|nr:universal stress protein [Paenibacillus plantiphilus]CAH1222155.1 hypothetical protein PAECIP111893_04821 [Paenibacillus plantiphilus]
MDGFGRKTPQDIIASINELQRGRLKVFIGAVSGSGKTYHMLRDGQTLLDRGVDVVICAVSTMQRPESLKQLGSLERVPSIHWTAEDGSEQKDLDLDALIARNPEVVLVDSLAHRNRPGAGFATRLEDIRCLLEHGISVLTTVNVYELDGMNELARRLTPIETEETVPADTLELAQEVVLIDVTPETLLSRAAAGFVKEGERFGRGNLAVLRELALRLVANGVNDSLEKYREQAGMSGPSGVAERILVSSQYHWNGSYYVRRGQQIAKRLNGELLVVTFLRPHKELSKEAAAFKRSICRLVDKFGGQFEELPLGVKGSISDALVCYARKNNVSRIVLGHSRQTRWQELWRGSIVHDMLKKTRNIDIFVLADRAAHGEEWIVPARTASSNDEEPFRRLSPQEMERQIQSINQGRFKVYIGAAPGVGKTYTMLREGHDLASKGIHVVVGLLETHGREETGAQAEGLRAIPRKIVSYRGTQLTEMDTEAIVQCRPDVVLVDELAHTNVPGSKHRKRYEDVLELLAAGISVISTVNVQHLESLNDAVEQMTGVRVRETVPDTIMKLADEVQLIDITPQSLQQRMREGKIYAREKVDQALSHFFQIGNLIGLRELALRELADDVDERLESWEQASSLRGPWRRKEVVYAAVDSSLQAERIVRRGFRIAYRLKATWYVTHVLHEAAKRQGELESRLASIRQLTERLGGTFIVHTASGGRRVPEVMVEHAAELGATQMIIGQSRRTRWHEWRKGAIVKTLLRTGRHMDLLVVARGSWQGQE